jgi:hypothetical protein
MTVPASDPSPPKAFISYSWDDNAHTQWVKDLATRLRGDGIDVTLDRWHAVPGDQLPAFMERAVRETDFVIAVCTPRYKQRSDDRTGGVGYEGDIMTAEAYSIRNQREFIPVLRGSKWEDAAPSWLLGKYYIDLRGEPYPEPQYEDLLRTLHGERGEVPPVGPRPNFGARIMRHASPASGEKAGEAVQKKQDKTMSSIEEEIRAVLRPLMGDREQRKARLDHAFAEYPALVDRIDVHGETGIFLTLLLKTLREFGEVESDRPAVCVLLESIKGEVGFQDQQRIERIVRDYPR